MEAYKGWIRRNKDCVHKLISLTSDWTWLLPGSDTDIGPAAVNAILGTVSTVNAHIIDTTPNEKNNYPAEPNAFPYSLCISALKDLEILFEVTAEQYYGSARKWNIIAAIEAFKVVIRLALFQKCGYRMILNGGDTPNTDNSSDFGQKRLNLEAKAITSLSRYMGNARMASQPPWWLQYHKSVMKPPASMVEKPTLLSVLSKRGFRGALFLLGELLFITRPLMYALFVRKYRTRSWIPWLLSLVVDFLGVGVFSPVSFSGKDQQFLPSDLEKSEMTRRKMLWTLYLLRDPFFTKYMRRRFERTKTVLEPVPVIGSFADYITDVIFGIQRLHKYMSGS